MKRERAKRLDICAGRSRELFKFFNADNAVDASGVVQSPHVYADVALRCHQRRFSVPSNEANFSLVMDVLSDERWGEGAVVGSSSGWSRTVRSEGM